MPAIASVYPTKSFDYARFDDPELQIKALNTLGNFLGFVRQTFDGLIESGRALQDLYYDCIAFYPDGKKLFDEWINSAEFGASRYIARSAMEIWKWFDSLKPRIQKLVRSTVQNWSVTALRQLTKVSTDLVEELVRSGKQTAASIKLAKVSSKSGGEGANASGSTPSPTVQFAPGMRVVVVKDDQGWTGASGVINSASDHQPDSVWVLLDAVASAGSATKNLFRTCFLQPEAEYIEQQRQLQEKNAARVTQQKQEKKYTQSEVQQLLAEARAQWEKEKAEEQLGTKIAQREAAISSAKEEYASLQRSLTQALESNRQLKIQLNQQQQEYEQVRSLATRNQELEQRVRELEKALADAHESRWGNTFTQQASKIVNANLAATLQPLQVALSEKEQQITELQALIKQQQSELLAARKTSTSHEPQSLVTEKEIVAQFGEIGERYGWDGWSCRGYLAANGMLFTGISAIAAFISDSMRESGHPEKLQEL